MGLRAKDKKEIFTAILLTGLCLLLFWTTPITPVKSKVKGPQKRIVAKEIFPFVTKIEQSKAVSNESKVPIILNQGPTRELMLKIILNEFPELISEVDRHCPEGYKQRKTSETVIGCDEDKITNGDIEISQTYYEEEITQYLILSKNKSIIDIIFSDGFPNHVQIGHRGGGNYCLNIQFDANRIKSIKSDLPPKDLTVLWKATENVHKLRTENVRRIERIVKILCHQYADQNACEGLTLLQDLKCEE